MSFQATGFWIAFFMQQVQRLTTLNVAVRLLPMAIAGLLWNVLAARILHRVNNTHIMIFGAISYLAAALLFSFMRADSNYWAFVFPALVLNVAGADLQFNVANVSLFQISFNSYPNSRRVNFFPLDVCITIPPQPPTIAGRGHL